MTVPAYLLAVLGAALMVAGIPPVSVWWLGLFAWVPLLVVAGSNSPRRAGILGWLQGALAQGCALAGAVPAMARTGGASTTVAILFGALLVAYEGARIGLVAFVTAHALRRSWPIGWAFPVVLVSVELTYPMIFPWTTQLFLDGAPILQQGAELGGPLATSAWVALLDASLARAWFARKDKAARLRHGVLAPALILVVVVAYGGARIHSVRAQMREAPTLTLGLIQENVTDVRTETRDPVALYRDASLALVSREKVDLLVWPETALYRPLDGAALREVTSAIYRAPDDPTADAHLFRASASPRLDVPILAGAVLRSPDQREDPRHIRAAGAAARTTAVKQFNSVVLMTPSGARDVYDKRVLVPFGEYVPGESAMPILRRMLPRAGAFSSGAAVEPFAFAGHRVSVSVCFEDLLVATDRPASGDAHLLVNLTSDAWFRETIVPSLHLALAKSRAIEHRRFLVRATNTGITAVVDPVGRIIARLPADAVDSAAVTVRWMSGTTPFDRIGELPWAAAVLIAAAFATLKKPSRRAPAEGHVADGR